MNIFESANELTVLFENRSNFNEIQYSSDLPYGFEISDTSLEVRVTQFYQTNFLFIPLLGIIRAECEFPYKIKYKSDYHLYAVNG